MKPIHARILPMHPVIYFTLLLLILSALKIPWSDQTVEADSSASEKSGLKFEKMAAPKALRGKGQFLNFQSTSPGTAPQVVPSPVPHPSASVSGLTGFEFSQSQEKLVLRFQTQDPMLHLSRSKPLAIQLITRHPFEVDPPVILTRDWPKDALQIPIQVRNADTNVRNNRIEGEATYTYCHLGTKECVETTSPILYYYLPGK